MFSHHFPAVCAACRPQTRGERLQRQWGSTACRPFQGRLGLRQGQDVGAGDDLSGLGDGGDIGPDTGREIIDVAALCLAGNQREALVDQGLGVDVVLNVRCVGMATT